MRKVEWVRVRQKVGSLRKERKLFCKFYLANVFKIASWLTVELVRDRNSHAFRYGKIEVSTSVAIMENQH